MAHHLTTRIESTAEAIRATGITVALDPREANPPCALIIPARCQVAYNALNFATYSIAFIAPAVNMQRANDMLYNMIEKAATAVAFPNPLQADQINLNGGAPLPAFITEIES